MDFYLPDTLTYRFPNDTIIVALLEDDQKLHRQLVCWCNLQRYWYYVMSQPQVEDIEYDSIEAYLKDMEEVSEPGLYKNPYSPTWRVGSARVQDYPKLIRMEFPTQSISPFCWSF